MFYQSAFVALVLVGSAAAVAADTAKIEINKDTGELHIKATTGSAVSNVTFRKLSLPVTKTTSYTRHNLLCSPLQVLRFAKPTFSGDALHSYNLPSLVFRLSPNLSSSPSSSSRPGRSSPPPPQNPHLITRCASRASSRCQASAMWRRHSARPKKMLLRCTPLSALRSRR